MFRFSSNFAARNALRNLHQRFQSTETSSSFQKYRKQFWDWTTQTRPHWKESKLEAAVLFCVFGITGSSSMYFVRPTLKTLGLEGTLIDGPWSYRIGSILIISPIYAVILFTIGTLCGRHQYFARSAKRILNRFVPEKVITRKSCEATEKLKKK